MNLHSYKLSDLQNMQHLLTQCEAAGITDIRSVRQRLHDHIAAVALDRAKLVRSIIPREKQRARQTKKSMTVCSVCGAPATIEPVNVSPATMAGDGLKTAILCLNAACLNTDYSTKTALDIVAGGPR